jgi:hypothetical protein
MILAGLEPFHSTARRRAHRVRQKPFRTDRGAQPKPARHEARFEVESAP